jgi:hypothetical protein
MFKSALAFMFSTGIVEKNFAGIDHCSPLRTSSRFDCQRHFHHTPWTVLGRTLRLTRSKARTLGMIGDFPHFQTYGQVV